MIDIDDIINRLIEHPSKEVLYSISESRLLETRKEINEGSAKSDIACLYGAKKCWETARKKFMSKHPGVFPELPSSCSAKVWNPLIEENSLEKEWFEEFRLAMTENVTHFAEDFAMKEVEAEPELYRAIKKELLAFEAKHYERKYCDMVIFRINADYEPIMMTILGNAGNVFGVSFYPSDFYGDNFLLIQNQERIGLEPAMSNALSTMLSFYFEQDPDGMPMPGCKDPFKCHDHLTSAYLHTGTIMRSYLPKSIALRALSYLRCANKEMARFSISPEGKLRDNCFYDVYLMGEKTAAFEFDPHESFNGRFPYDFNDIAFLDAPLKFKKGGAFDATLRCMPGYASVPGYDERVVRFTYLALICDHESGYIHVNSIGTPLGSHPFDDLVEHLSESLEKLVIPKKIYVNTYLDLLFYRHYFAPYIQEGKVKVELSSEELKTDCAFEEMLKCLEQGWDEEEEAEQKRPAQA